MTTYIYFLDILNLYKYTECQKSYENHLIFYFFNYANYHLIKGVVWTNLEEICTKKPQIYGPIH